ncbi:MAG: hypothetical protein FJZ87_13650 [Chloroflexi bacterium]|nr:hypothetical protein [Chloroflexota bacterium]
MKKLIFVVALGLAACGSNVRETPILPEFISTPSGFIDPSYPTAQANLQSASQVSGGIEVRIEKAWMEGKNLNANVCFTLPDAADWSIYAARLDYGGIVQQEYGTTLLSIQDSTSDKPGLRCDMLTFVIQPDADLSSATIVIESIAATPREGEYCSIYMPKIQQAVLDRGIGIVLECVEDNGVLTMRITSYPPELSLEQAEEIVYSEEFFTVKGPWSFPFDLSQ